MKGKPHYQDLAKFLRRNFVKATPSGCVWVDSLDNEYKQQEVAYEISVDPATLSRAVNGQGGLQFPHATKLLDLMRASPPQRERLYEIVGAIAGLGLDLRIVREPTLLGAAAELRRSGQPWDAIKVLKGALKVEEGRAQASGTTERALALRNIPMLLYELARAYKEVYTPPKIGEELPRIAQEIEQYSRAIEATDDLFGPPKEHWDGIAGLIRGDALYIQGDWVRAYGLLQDAPKLIRDREDQQTALRAEVNAAARAGVDDREFRKLADFLRKVAEKPGSSAHAVSRTYEGLASAFACKREGPDLRKARDCLDELARTVEVGTLPPIRVVQLLRTRLTVQMLEDPDATNAHLALAEQAISLAREHGYARHEAQIKRVKEGLERR